MNNEMERWERKEGVKFLKKIGIKAGQKVLDFGARVGHYSIPASMIVGNKGMVYAVDKDHEALNELKQKIAMLNIGNIRITKNSGELMINLNSKSIDVALLYDVLHYIKKRARKILYNDIFRILKPNGLISVYPKHILEDSPLDEFKELCLEDVKQEIQNSGFLFKEKHCGTISHDDWLNQGCVLNFRKSFNCKG